MSYLKIAYELLVFVILAIVGASIGTLVLHHIFQVYYV
jgi:hypothetical protein